VALDFDGKLSRLAPDVRGLNLYSFMKILASRDRDWWGTESNWIIIALNWIRHHDSEGYTRDLAAAALKPIVDVYPEEEAIWSQGTEERRLSTIRAEMSTFKLQYSVTQQSSSYLDAVRVWAEGAEKA